MSNHTFVICAYKECHYLDELIESLLAQTVKSDIIIETSTLNEFIKGVADRFGIKVYANPGKGGITEDWNYAMSLADTRYVTIAHQDDVYLPTYTEEMLESVEKVKKPLIFFTDYAELRNGEVVKDNTNLKVKRELLKPIEPEKNWNRKSAKRRILSLGNPICCPSVTYCMDNVPTPLFQNHFQSNEDWEAWERLSKIDGAFVYKPEILMYHRIHVDSTTTKVIGHHSRTAEDREMFGKFHSEPIAGILTKLYSLSEKSNQI